MVEALQRRRMKIPITAYILHSDISKPTAQELFGLEDLNYNACPAIV